ncbi:YiiX family permuted papain-like enzyme [Escherichia coli]|nr:YiiX family permuted papain-like enzyme [Escherichia coli]MDN0643164.1 YiiX family permuted papain-like enzyme [Escherichia coli]
MKNRLLILSLLVSVPAFAWQPQTGDIIFQISRSSQSKAIQLATHTDYSHTGMLVIRNKKPYVFEAVGPVKYTPLKQWIAHGEKGKYVVRRVEGGLSVEQQQKLAQTAKRYLGKPYDFSFSWSDDRQYCSEVVWKVYQNALGMRVGEQQKLKEFDLSSPEPVTKVCYAQMVKQFLSRDPFECVLCGGRMVYRRAVAGLNVTGLKKNARDISLQRYIPD